MRSFLRRTLGQAWLYRYSSRLSWKARNRVNQGPIRWGSFRTLEPLNREWGFDRGKPIDRYYIETFLQSNREAIRGRVLSVGDDFYARSFGREISQSDVLHVNEAPNATIVGDLTDAPQIPGDAFDCFLLVQTLQLIYDLHAAVATSYRVLKPGGVVLATLPGITPYKDGEWNDSWSWNFTKSSAGILFREIFPAEHVTVRAFGNVLAATAFLHGIGVPDLSEGELDYLDPAYEVTITVKAKKPR